MTCCFFWLASTPIPDDSEWAIYGPGTTIEACVAPSSAVTYSLRCSKGCHSKLLTWGEVQLVAHSIK